MKITVFNGSPMGEAGNTNDMVKAFLKGAQTGGAEVENIFLNKKEVNHCKACRHCIISGGECSTKDDMRELVLKFVESDIVVFATPIYIDNVSGMTKVFMDRLFCIGNPYFEKDENGECRGQKSKHFKNGSPPKVIVISNCGYPERETFQVVSLLMKRFTRQFHLNLIAEIYATEGAVFSLLKAGVKDFEPLISRYLTILEKAGCEIATDMKLSTETQHLLEQNFIPIEDYFKLANRMADMIPK